MNSSSATNRKAAILVASVDGRTAELLLGQMAPDEARSVRRAAASLDAISAEEREAVLLEFSQSTADSTAHPDMAATLLEEHDGIREPAGLPTGDPPVNCNTEEWSQSPALRQADSETLARLLAQEQPQTIATLFTRLDVQQAAEILRRLRPAVQAEVVQRLATTDRAAPQVLRDMERALETQLSQPAVPPQRCSGGVGLSAAARLLDAASYDLRQNLLSSLARRDAALARRLASSPLRAAVDVTA